MHLTMTVLPCVAGFVLLFSDTLNNNNNMKTEDISYATYKWRVKHPDWIGNHFYMGEFIYSAIAVDKGLDNTPPPVKLFVIWYANYWNHFAEDPVFRSTYPVDTAVRN